MTKPRWPRFMLKVLRASQRPMFQRHAMVIRLEEITHDVNPRANRMHRPSGNSAG
jgi:hypothetical protein